VTGRCADLSREAGESLGATAVTADRWLLVEVPGSWPREVTAEGPLPDDAQQAVASWLHATPRSRLQFIRRPGRARKKPLVFAVLSEESAAGVRRIELESHADLASVDLSTAGDDVESSLVLVCGHGSRDRCCALRGTEVFASLSERLGKEELWFSSHQGGHRFAANVLVLPSGLQFGRVETDEAPFVVARALAGRIELERFRGRTCYEAAVQAAELAVRQARDMDGVGDLRLEAAAQGAVTFRACDGASYSAVVDQVTGPAVPASCGADPEPQRSFRARVR
jgi:hypothetical protein